MEHDNPEELTAAQQDLLVLAALDLLEPAEAGRLETHLRTGCSVCRQELQSLRETLARISYALPPEPAPSRVKLRLMERVTSSAPLVFPSLDFVQLDWEPSPYPGVSFYFLRRGGGPTDRGVSALVRIEPNCSYPAHLHPGGEECLLLQGACRDSFGEYRAPSYMWYRPGSEHHDFQALECGPCVMFVSAAQGIDLLPEDRAGQ